MNAESGEAVVELLVAAKAYLVEHGWWRRGLALTSLDVRCAGQARWLHARRWSSNPYSSPAKAALATLADVVDPVNDREQNTLGRIVAWNDAPGRTFTDVLDAYDAAVRLAKERHR